jgi:hypothetical protein
MVLAAAAAAAEHVGDRPRELSAEAAEAELGVRLEMPPEHDVATPGLGPAWVATNLGPSPPQAVEGRHWWPERPFAVTILLTKHHAQDQADRDQEVP